MIVKESISFKRGKSSREIKTQLTGKWIPGQIFIRSVSSPKKLEIWVYRGIKSDNIWGTSIVSYPMGELSKNYKEKPYTSFIFNTKDIPKKGYGLYPKTLGLRLPTEDEKERIQKHLDSRKDQRYVDMITKLIGAELFV